MKTVLIGIIIALCLAATTAADCGDYWVSETQSYGTGTICVECQDGISDCSSGAGSYDQYDDFIDGVDDDGNLFCFMTYLYDSEKLSCDIECKPGCYQCFIDADYCTDCSDGYVWNSDFTCLPSVLGLLAATLAILVIGLVFVIIALVKVFKASK